VGIISALSRLGRDIVYEALKETGKVELVETNRWSVSLLSLSTRETVSAKSAH